MYVTQHVPYLFLYAVPRKVNVIVKKAQIRQKGVMGGCVVLLCEIGLCKIVVEKKCLIIIQSMFQTCGEEND